MSSDKAVNPTNAMGASKIMGEKLIAASNNLQNFGGTVFCNSRSGNVLGSRGSVVPIFINQLKEGLNLTVTNTYMTRFVMKKEETFNLILKSLEISKGGETFILKMDSIKIGTTDPRRGGSWLNKIPLLSNQAPLFYHLL